MKTKILLFGTVLAALVSSSPSAVGQTSNRTIQVAYQGRLTVAGNPAPIDFFDMDFRLYDAATNGNQIAQLCEPYVSVLNGLFTVPLDFGANAFNGTPRWVGIAVRPATNNPTAPFTLLSPRQRVWNVPTAVHALNADMANTFTGAVSVVQLPAAVARLDASQTFVAPPTFMPASGPPFMVGNTQLVANLNAGLLDGLDATAFWRRSLLDGVAKGVEPVDVPVEIHIQNTRVLRLERGQTVPNLIGGSSANTITQAVSGSVITGGGGLVGPNCIAANGGFIGAGLNNRISANADHSAVVGGHGNQIAPGARESIIGGGASQRIGSNSIYAGIFSGSANEVMANSRFAGVLLGANNKVCEHSDFAAVLSGANLVVDEDAPHSVIAGGARNLIGDGAHSAFVGGGQQNIISTQAVLSVIVGGQNNRIDNGAYRSAVGGGNNNTIGPASYNAFLGGGEGNKIEFNAPYSAILGGNLNVVRANAGWATVLGGVESVAGAPFAIAAGHGAKALHSGSIVLADGQYASFASSNANEFAVRAAGGVRFDTAGKGLVVDGLKVLGGSGMVVTNGGNAESLDGFSSEDFWRLTGNAGTTAGLHFLGTTDNQPLELKVNGLRALRLEDNGDSASDFGTAPDGAPNLIGGSPANFVGAGIVGATIAGGGATDYVGLDRFTTAFTNSVLAEFGAVGGGLANRIGPSAFSGTIAGGFGNDIGTNSDFSAIGGGVDHNIATDCSYSTVAGGFENDIGANSHSGAIGGGYGNNIAADSLGSTIAGGTANDIGANSASSAIGGGYDNNIADNSPYATIPGGRDNAANGGYSFAAGHRAIANHPGSFVWADSGNFDFTSTAGNQFNVRAVGGVRIVTGIDGSGTPDAGVTLNANDSSWNVVSDRSAKKNFRPADGREILERLARLPIEHWNYKWETAAAVPHLGPAAQDFKAAFYPGRDDKTISTLEADGVALAAIQGLNQKLTEELKRRDTENADLKQRLEKLEQLMNHQNGGAR